MLGLPEVTTKLSFLEISTRLYEIQKCGKIKLDTKGTICRPENEGQGAQGNGIFIWNV